MIRLILLIGLPGSGKSSLAQQLVTQSQRCQLISTDAIRAQLFGDESIQGPWLLVWEQLQRQFQQAVARILQHQILEAIYDATNAVQEQRRDAIALARSIGFTQITGLWLDIPLQVCLERNRTRQRRVPEEVIVQMYRSLQAAPPSFRDGLDQLIRCTDTHSTEIAIAPLQTYPPQNPERI